MRLTVLLATGFLIFSPLMGCDTVYYNTLEKAGIHKRDILVDRVEDAQDSQKETQQQFKDALAQFSAIVKTPDTDLKTQYNQLNREYEASEASANRISDHIEQVEDVADDLFDEWADEIRLYTNRDLKQRSEQNLKQTRQRYKRLIAAMREAESNMKPVLDTLRDHVLYLKHNLNAQAISSLRGELTLVQKDVEVLIASMQRSISESDKFIQQMGGAAR